MFLLRRYKSAIFNNNQLSKTDNRDLLFWRKYLFSNVLIFLFPLCFIALIPGLYVSYLTDQKIIFAVDLIAFFSFVMLTFYPRWSFRTRKNIFTFTNYFLAFALLLLMGLTGPGELYLLSTAVFSVLIYPPKNKFYWPVISLLICLTAGLLLYADFISLKIESNLGLVPWLAITSNLIFLSSLASFLLPKVFLGLEKTIQREKKLGYTLKSNQIELEQVLQELKNKNTELEQFSSIASHDLKEPVRLIKSYMELLKVKYKDQLDEKAQKYIDFAVNSSNHITHLINDLLNYAKLDDHSLEYTTIDLEQLIKESLNLHNDVITEKNAVVNVEINCQKLTGYKALIKILINNLLNNALKYIEVGQTPYISIVVDESEENVYLKISDQGIGISEEFQEKIFQMFTRLHSKSEYEGTGLGLAICKKIMEKHKGNIILKSQLNKGSTFTCVFPKKI